MCVGRTDVLKVFGSDPKVTLEEAYQYKEEKVALISKIINDSHVKLDGISYWSLTDGIDYNLERIRSNYLRDGSITNIEDIPTVCEGLLPTHKKLIYKLQQNEDISLETMSSESSLMHM